jgi:hypothetical protein
MMGSAPLAGMVSGISAAQQTRAPPDQGHELTPDGADMGSLFPTPQEPSLAVNNPVGRILREIFGSPNFFEKPPDC